MPPKKNSKSTAGGHFSGITRAGPGTVDIGSMVPQHSIAGTSVEMPSNLGHDGQVVRSTEARSLTTAVSSGVQQTEASGKSNNPSFHAINIGNYCHFCCDHIQQPYCHECVDCGGIMCQQSIPWGSSCIYYGTVDTTKDAPLPYAVLGYWIRKKVKMAWPMAIVSLSLESLKDNYLASTVRCEVEYHYKDNRENLFVKELHMRGGAHVTQSRKLAEGVSFMKHNIEAGFPPNTFVIVDTHSNKEIVTTYLGEEFLKGTANASLAATSDESVITTKTGKEPWCKLTPNARGGRRVLMLLVDKDMFDFVLGFSGSGMLPSFISTIMRSLIVECGGILNYTTAVLVYATTTKGKQNVECHQIAKNSPGRHAFGTEYRSCGTAGCNLSVTNICVYNRSTGRPKVSLLCLKCGWTSVWVRTDEDNEHFKRVHPVLAPQVFWHHFPPSTGLQNFFVDLTDNNKDKSSQSCREKEGKSKGGKGNAKKRRHAVMDEHMMEDEVNPIAMDVDA
ncbi:uncharacterized protein EDB91DRAFT_1241280 [Suillus paluster]|uniref:uncharacterized protein n=1 Tax=Suillus paluster TaxID=48578 RepID=UPI001B863B24|nr:uncharacterized protein EDB91DRAFT_1241280 [Suillus paluster]KAG1756183.1 hypothetical protein EDB91DRAFT_1241280 [Suillus paluster]